MTFNSELDTGNLLSQTRFYFAGPAAKPDTSNLNIKDINSPPVGVHLSGTHPSNWPHLAPIKISWWYLKRFESS